METTLWDRTEYRVEKHLADLDCGITLAPWGYDPRFFRRNDVSSVHLANYFLRISVDRNSIFVPAVAPPMIVNFLRGFSATFTFWHALPEHMISISQ